MIIIIGFSSGHPLTCSGSYHPLYLDQIGIWKVLVFVEREKLVYLEKNLSEKRREPRTNYWNLGGEKDCLM